MVPKAALPAPHPATTARKVADFTSLGYAVLGIGLSAGGVLFALTRARAKRSFYAVDVYHMTARTHRRFAALSAGFAAAFVGALRWPAVIIPALAIYALALILYLSSFARGFSGEDE